MKICVLGANSSHHKDLFILILIFLLEFQGKTYSLEYSTYEKSGTYPLPVSTLSWYERSTGFDTGKTSE